MTQADGVEAMLREMILEMQLGPGERVTERWAEGQFGASRTPVRAALLRLEADGLVRREGRGWIVAPLDIREIEQLYAFREVLEVAAVRLAANRVSSEGTSILSSLASHCAPRSSAGESHRSGTEFHTCLADIAGNEFIKRGISDAMTRLSRARYLDTGPENKGWNEHKAMVAALRKGDVGKAEQLMHDHVRGSCERLLKTLNGNRRTLRASGIVVGDAKNVTCSDA